MKRWLSILAVLGCIVALSGCKNEAEQAYFNAKVLEVNKEYVDVRCIEAFNSGISVDEEFSVTKDVVSAGGAPELNVDDISWVNSEKFKELTTSDASNNQNKLVNRIEYVRDQLLGVYND